MNCSKCGHKLEKYEHYVELKDGTIFDETCFFELAIKTLDAKEEQNGITED